MKKIAAFITAVLLFFVSAFAMSVGDEKDIRMNNPKVGLWVNDYKDKSEAAIRENMGKKMILLLGSSEFHYGKKTPYHPSEVFRDRKEEFMIVGAAYTQSLFHGILVGAVEPSMKKREAIILVSPSWFKEKGVAPGAFATRFSESEYLAFLTNENISLDTKKKVAALVEQRLSSFKEMKNKVALYNKAYVYDTATPVERLVALGQKLWSKKADHISFKSALKLTKIKKYQKWVKPHLKSGQAPLGTRKNWEGKRKKAETEAILRAGNNPFFMSQKLFQEKVEPRMARKKDSSLHDSYAVSPEYEDLELFIKICKETNITPKIIMLPQNGYWYDYTGFPKQYREIARDKVKKIADDNQVKFVDLYGESYEKYFFKDTVHPSAKGWIKINEAIAKLY